MTGESISDETETKRFYQSCSGRLIDVHVVGGRSDYWDKHWKATAGEKRLAAIHSPNSMVLRITERYLRPGASVLEGGCGLGQNVWGLEKKGFKVWGIDNAEETVESVRNCAPDLKISLGDVQKLEFADAYFDGYWSLGVIEHFWHGYDEILAEMARVIKPGGYLFLTFPAMNAARKSKAKRGGYPEWTSTTEAQFRDGFYQFLLPVDAVEKDLQKFGFKTVECRFLDGFKGVKDETSIGRAFIRALSVAGLKRIAQKVMNLLLSHRYGHVVLLVLRRE
ncbi:MAG: methyltransferase domain-containing protein [Gammaproteobacteria bacterium]|nr:methyltransferase domain-containing protein [Gammaproteobacteria bacterium]